MDKTPVFVLVFSGKRKSGKDFVTDLLKTRVGDKYCAIIRLSAPLKEQYAKEHQLNFERLLDASDYKEQYRADMICWGEKKREQDPSFFCRAATSGSDSKKPVWIISDARRHSDLHYFRTTYSSITRAVRVEALESVRQCRGYVFTSGVDDAESECGLDAGVDWDYDIRNDGDNHLLQASLDPIIREVRLALGQAF